MFLVLFFVFLGFVNGVLGFGFWGLGFGVQLLLALELNDDGWLPVLAGSLHLERQVRDVLDKDGVVHLAADHALGVKHRVGRVHSGLVFGGIADEALRVGKGNPRRGGAVALVVGDDLRALVLPDSDARVGGAQIDADRRAVDLLLTMRDPSVAADQGARAGRAECGGGGARRGDTLDDMASSQ